MARQVDVRLLNRLLDYLNTKLMNTDTEHLLQQNLRKNTNLNRIKLLISHINLCVFVYLFYLSIPNRIRALIKFTSFKSTTSILFTIVVQNLFDFGTK